MKFSDLGNDLYTGRRSIPVVRKRARFYLVSLILMAIAVSGLAINKLNLGLEFSGGSEFRVTSTSVPSDYESTAREALAPGLDQTRTVGLVTLPGAFIGVLLGGGTPLEAGAAQVLVLIGLLAGQALTCAVLLRLVASARVVRRDLAAVFPR